MPAQARTEERLPFIPLLLICLLALWLRIPGICAGLPYFYAEDEAHHFNRTVEMVKEGRYDPQYFHKPSLHFYLRMPVVALSYLWAAKRGQLTSIKDIETRNSFGLAGYAFTASHPGIVKWNRAFSVALSLLTIIFTFLLCREVTGNVHTSLAAALLVSVSPEFLINSPIIGVDILMALMCTISAYAALLVYKNYTTRRLIVLGLLCGLAVSSKYNALPIAVLPLVVCLGVKRFCLRDLASAALAPIAGFFLGSPYILVSIPLFLDHLAYEIWHYGVAGHEGHSAQPGLEQAGFYVRWLAGDGIGLLACFAALAGFALLKAERKKEAALFLIYPVLFAALMIGQKANFTRNMVSIIPFVAVLAAAGLELLLKPFRLKHSTNAAIFWIGVPIVCLQPLVAALSFNRQLLSRPESRIAAAEWITTETSSEGDVAISGELQFPTNIYRLPGKSRVDPSVPLAKVLYQSGFDTLIVGPEYVSKTPEESGLLLLKKSFDGDSEPQRIESNPRISVLELVGDKTSALLMAEYSTGHLADKFVLPVSLENSTQAFACSDPSGKSLLNPGEEHCWLQSRFSALYFQPKAPIAKPVQGTLILSVMTPWQNQTLQLSTKAWSHSVDFSQTKPGEWTDISIPMPSDILQSPDGVLFHLSQVHSPFSRKLSADNRRLGIAIRSAQYRKG